MKGERNNLGAGPTGREQPKPGQTGLPWLRTWPRVYGLVLAAFALWVALLAALSRICR